MQKNLHSRILFSVMPMCFERFSGITSPLSYEKRDVRRISESNIIFKLAPLKVLLKLYLSTY